MGSREMGRHWSSEEGWQVSTLREIEGEQEEISKMCPYCKSTLHECFTKGECGQTKAPMSNTGPKPTNVKTIVKRTNKANGGYIGSFIDLNVDGKTYSNPSYKKYYKGLI
jgi:hypothetical protein